MFLFISNLQDLKFPNQTNSIIQSFRWAEKWVSRSMVFIQQECNYFKHVMKSQCTIITTEAPVIMHTCNMSIFFPIDLSHHDYESAVSIVDACSPLSFGTLQACNSVHTSFVSRNCSALIRIRGPYSKTILLHCQKIQTRC